MDIQHTTISSQGQIFLPSLLRKKYQLESGDRIVFQPDNNRIYLKKIPKKLSNSLLGIMGKKNKKEIDIAHRKWKIEWEKQW